MDWIPSAASFEEGYFDVLPGAEFNVRWPPGGMSLFLPPDLFAGQEMRNVGCCTGDYCSYLLSRWWPLLHYHDAFHAVKLMEGAYVAIHTRNGEDVAKGLTRLQETGAEWHGARRQLDIRFI
jgi:hypothetical protein